MFAMHRDRSSSGSSTRSTSSSRSLSLSPGGWNPSKAAASPATTTTTPFGTSPTEASHDGLAPLASTHHRKLLGGSRLETFAPASAFNSYAYPCWPAGDALSHRRHESNESGSSRIAQAYTPYYAPPSSRISDDDLACLDFSRPVKKSPTCDQFQGGISWSQVGTGAVGQEVLGAGVVGERRRRLPPPPPGLAMERRSSDRGTKRRKGSRN